MRGGVAGGPNLQDPLIGRVSERQLKLSSARKDLGLGKGRRQLSCRALMNEASLRDLRAICILRVLLPALIIGRFRVLDRMKTDS